MNGVRGWLSVIGGCTVGNLFVLGDFVPKGTKSVAGGMLSLPKCRPLRDWERKNKEPGIGNWTIVCLLFVWRKE